MKALLRFAWAVLTFKHEAYADHVARPDVLKRALALLVMATLLAGLTSLVVGIVNGLHPVDWAAQEQEMRQGMKVFLDSLRPVMDLPPGFEEGMEEAFDAMQSWLEVGARIGDLPTPLPKPVGIVLSNLGAFLSLPFSRMAGWLGYTLWVLLMAKLLGGKATLPCMLGSTALYVVPHVLGILAPIPCLGALAGLVAIVWGIAIYVKAVAVANDLSVGKAVLATILPALVAAALILVALLFLVILALVSG